jgi:ubiquinone/menaquinone biosynthesis C-methylase UbiE
VVVVFPSAQRAGAMSFDRLAPFYRGMEFILAGRKLQRCRLAWMDEVKDCREVLIVGEGPGRFLTECIKKLPKAQILCLDDSAAMLAQARLALQREGQDSRHVTFVQATLPEWKPPSGKFDLLVTHFFLDCFPPEQLRQVVSQLASGAQPGARWLLADFCEPPRGVARWRAKLILTMAYAFFGLATRLPARRLTEPDRYLEENGMGLKGRRTYEGGLLHSDLWQAALHG